MTVTVPLLRRRAPAVVAALVSAGLLGACGGAGTDDDVVAVAVSAPPSTSAPVAVSAAKTTTAELEAALITKVPSGYAQQPDSVARTGPTDEAKAIGQEDAVGGKEVLAGAGYVNGFQRLWARGENAMLAVSLYVFETDVGASDYNAHNAYAFAAVPGASSFAVNGVPGAKGVFGKSSDANFMLITFVRGRYVVTVQLSDPNADRATATALAVQQYNNLV